jgi:hypothetical protein
MSKSIKPTMKILFNGDSNMCGEELDDRSLGIAPQVSSMLGMQEINLSLTGSSNDRIYDTTMSYVQNQTAPDLIVIGWSEYTRMQWFLTNTDLPEWREINTIGVGQKPLPDEYLMRLEHLHEHAQNPNYRQCLSFYWHERIYNLHKYLEHLYIPHVFFHAFHDFKMHFTQYHLDWNNRFMNPYNRELTYVHWCAGNNYKEITPGKFHYEPAAQRAWAEKLVEYINQNNII